MKIQIASVLLLCLVASSYAATCETAWDELMNDPEQSHTRDAIKEAGLKSYVNSPTKKFTLFAPTNRAWEHFAVERGFNGFDDLLAKLVKTNQLTDVVLSHVVPDEHAHISKPGEEVINMQTWQNGVNGGNILLAVNYDGSDEVTDVVAYTGAKKIANGKVTFWGSAHVRKANRDEELCEAVVNEIYGGILAPFKISP